MFVVQQDISKSTIYRTLKDKWNSLRSYEHEADAQTHLNRLMKDANLDNKRCPIRVVSLDRNAIISRLVKK